MTDSWIPSPPQPPVLPSDPIPPANFWNSVEACSIGPNQPSIVSGIVINGVPATISSLYWQVSLNDGSGNFQINQLDGLGNFIGTVVQINYSNMRTVFTASVAIPSLDDLIIPGGPVGTYIGSIGGGALSWFAPVISMDAPADGTPYSRQNNAWVGTETFIDAPTDGQTYGRSNSQWNPALAITGGALTGQLTIVANQPLTIQAAGGGNYILAQNALSQNRWAMMMGDSTPESGSNVGANFGIYAFADNGSTNAPVMQIDRRYGTMTLNTLSGVGPVPNLILNSPTASMNRAIMAQTNGSNRWQLSLADPSGEIGSNLGSNFTLQRYADNGAVMGLPNPFNIARNTGNATFGYGVTITGTLSLAAPANLSVGGGTAGQVLSTDGSGNLSWTTISVSGYLPLSGGNMTGGIQFTNPSGRYVSGNNGASLRWAVEYGDTAAESGGNAGSNFAIQRFSDAGTPLGTALGIARSTGVATFSALPSFPGGAAGNVLTTNGAGILSWGQGGASVTVADTPPASPSVGALWWDSVGGQMYVWYQDANSSQWVPASNPPTNQGAAGVTTWNNRSGAVTMTVADVVVAASTTPPLMDGTAAVGTASTYARDDHVHPTDTSRYSATNPSNFQTAAQVTASLGNYLPLAGGTISGSLAVGGALVANNPNFYIRGASPIMLLQTAGGASTLSQFYNATGSATYVTNISPPCNISLAGNVTAAPSAGNNFLVTPGIGYQTGGGSWGSLSDERIKTVEGDYELGLSEILALRPIVYVYKGNDALGPGEQSMHEDAARLGTKYVGLVAQEAEQIFPAMVGKQNGFIDGNPVDDLRTLNNSELIYALVNAVKTLTARVEELEARR